MANATTPSDDQQTSECNLIVNYLPWMMNQEEVRRLFARVGVVVSCRLVKDKRTGQSLGYAFVRYRSRSMANRAIQTFNGFRIQNKVIKVSIARPRCSRLRGANVYVSGLDSSVTSVDLDDLFRPFGKIISCRVLCDERTGLSRGVGFVLFNLRSEAETAIRCLNSTVPPGAKQPLRLKFATRPTSGLPRGPRFLPLTAVTLPPMGICGGPFVGPTQIAASNGLTAFVKLTTPDKLDDVIRCNLATTNVDTVVHPPMNIQRCPTHPVSRQVAFVEQRTRSQQMEATLDGDQQQQQPLLDSDQDENEEDEEEKDEKERASVESLSSPQPTIVIRNPPSDVVDQSTPIDVVNEGTAHDVIEGTPRRRLLVDPLWIVEDIRLQGHRAISSGFTNIGQSTVIPEAMVRNAQEATLQAKRALDGLKKDKMSNRSSGQLKLLMRNTQQQQQQRFCDGRLSEEFGQSFFIGKDFNVCQGRGPHLCQGQGLHSAKEIGQCGMVDKRRLYMEGDSGMDQSLNPMGTGLVATQGLALCQGQALDLWTNQTPQFPPGYTTINPTTCWLKHLSSYGFCSCSQPRYLSICPQDIQTTFHLSCP